MNLDSEWFASELAELKDTEAKLRVRIGARKNTRQRLTQELGISRSVLTLDPSHKLIKSVEGTAKDAASGGPVVEESDEDVKLPLRSMIASALLKPATFNAIDVNDLHRQLCAEGSAYEGALEKAGVEEILPVLNEMAEGEDAYLEMDEMTIAGKLVQMVLDINRMRLASLTSDGNKRKRGVPGPAPPPGPPPPGKGIKPVPKPVAPKKISNVDGDVDLEDLLSAPSYKERQMTETEDELAALLGRQTAKETATVQQFKSKGGPALRQYCQFLTKEDCRMQRGAPFACEGLHFVRIIQPHTDVSLGDCNYLDTCNHMSTCKRIHYELDPSSDIMPFYPAICPTAPQPSKPVPSYLQALGEPQWINCDVRNFDYSTIGKFGVIMADPPWEIHMDLPYGIITDDEMRSSMDISCLQDNGVIFLWVTGRAMELGRELLDRWGYSRVEELIWVKMNQLQRIIRTGRTGHWLNHSKEHCLVGIKGSPVLNRCIDIDVLVAEVRETSRKPDEMYPLLERLSPGTRKLEIFGRPHNIQSGWITLGNQLDGTHLVDPELRKAFLKRYPDQASTLTPPAEPSEMPGGGG